MVNTEPNNKRDCHKTKASSGAFNLVSRMSVQSLLSLCPKKSQPPVHTTVDTTVPTAVHTTGNDDAAHTTGDDDVEMKDKGLLQYCIYLYSIYGCVYM